MRLNEIAPGQKKPMYGTSVPDKFDAVWDRLIMPNCTDILDVYKDTNQYLFRGMKLNPDFFRAMSRADRKPADSGKYMADMFNKLLAANGMTALRNNSIFAVSDMNHSKAFGQPYIIFPINGFDFTYTNQSDIVLNDWNKFIPDEIMFHLNKVFRAYMHRESPDTYLGTYDTWLNWAQFHDPQDPLKDLNNAIERMKKMAPEDPVVKDLSIETLINSQGFAEKFEPRNSDLGFAIKRGLEVYIHGQYYAFKHSIYGNLIRLKMRDL
jgi:hypothetical protein